MAILKVDTSYLDSIKSNHNYMKAFSLWLKLKVRYKNGIVYKYNPEQLSKDFKISCYQTRKCINDLITLGLITKNGRCLLLKSFRTIRQGNKVQKEIEVHMTDSICSVVTKLQFALLKANLIDKQLHLKKTYTNFDEFNYSKSDYGQWKRDYRNLSKLGYDFTEKVDVKIHAGYRKMALLMGVSQSSVRKLLDQFIRWKYIKGINYFIEKLFNIDYKSFMVFKKVAGDGEFLFYKDGGVFKHKGTLLWT
jgi:hypothetical protein